jgi:hypothetical protein
MLALQQRGRASGSRKRNGQQKDFFYSHAHRTTVERVRFEDGIDNRRARFDDGALALLLRLLGLHLGNELFDVLFELFNRVLVFVVPRKLQYKSFPK